MIASKCLRQGDILKFDNSPMEKERKLIRDGRLGAFKESPLDIDSYFLVLSQDCTITGFGKHVELLQIKTKEKSEYDIEMGLSTGKDYNRLMFTDSSGNVWLGEPHLVTAVKHVQYDKILLNCLLKHDELTRNSMTTVLNWRIGYYNREPFPHNFNTWFGTVLHEKGFIKRLTELHDDIRDLHIWVSPEDEDAKKYHVAITAVTYSEEERGSPVRVLMDDLINCLAETYCSELVMLALEEDEMDVLPSDEDNITVLPVTSSDDFTFANADAMRRFNLDYICNRAVL